MFSPQALAFSVAFIIRALADCKCGYTINAGKPTLDNPLFTDHISTDFTTSTDVTFESEPGKSWQVQAYNATAAQSNNAPYGRTAQLKNVVLNTLPPGYISSEGVHGGDPGLQLWVRSQLVQNGSESYVPIAEVVTARNDILYGSFRASMKTTGVNGTCGAFFFYHNDSQEIDVEILSKDQLEPNASHPVNLILQSPAAVRAGNDAANTSTFYLYGMLPAPDQMYIEYRWDWLPDRVDFYIQERLIHTMRDSVPQAPGTVHLIHWSTGNEVYSSNLPPICCAVSDQCTELERWPTSRGRRDDRSIRARLLQHLESHIHEQLRRHLSDPCGQCYAAGPASAESYGKCKAERRAEVSELERVVDILCFCSELFVFVSRKRRGR